jgi:hypothetical protein
MARIAAASCWPRPPASRLVYDRAQDTLFLNFAGLEVKCSATIAAIGDRVTEVYEPLVYKVKAMVARCYREVSRYTTSLFMRNMLGKALPERGLARMSLSLRRRHRCTSKAASRRQVPSLVPN